MAAKQGAGSGEENGRRNSEPRARIIGPAVNVAINRGYVVGREVLARGIPGIVVGYNIASFGKYVGNVYPLVVRTSHGVTKCALDEVSLA